uniref:AlNc14C4G559 protein n=1 Tax=Albugo laibachii Nc14 TaxID=890382 RepID=F0W0B6_9STRA|nr:AlNc14C4G559 [Albugo laibachii Nc14]|eukprot:CCA14488.1 AlNc14C4G559 [Albugo laibachii Nc14]
MKEQDRNLEAMSSYDINARLRPLLTLSFLQSFSWGITAPLISIAMTQYYATQNQLPGEHIDCFHHATDRVGVRGGKQNRILVLECSVCFGLFAEIGHVADVWGSL